MSMAYPLREPLPHGRHARDVHARRVHDRRRARPPRARSSAPSTTSTTSAAASTSAPTTRPASPLADMPRRARAAPRRPAGDFRVVASESVAAGQGPPGRRPRADASLPRARRSTRLPRAHDLRARRHRATGYGSAAPCGAPSRTHPGPRRRRLADRPAQAELQLRRRRPPSGSRASTSRTALRSRPVVVRDPQTGKSARLTVIGVLSDTAPLDDGRHLDLAARRSRPPSAPRACRPSTRSRSRRASTRRRPRRRSSRRFLANGMEADVDRRSSSHDAVGASFTFNRLIEGFMGLGLIVGVAALGVISARSVVERRQQIGVLRAIGFRRGMVQACFLLESSFIALTAIVVGTGLGLAVALQRHLRHAPPAELGRACRSTSRGSRSADLPRRLRRSRCSRRSRRRGEPRASIRPRPSATSECPSRGAWSWSALRSWQCRGRTPSNRGQTRTFIVATSLVATQLAIAGLSDLSAGALWPGMAKLSLAALGPLSWRTFDEAGGRSPS